MKARICKPRLFPCGFPPGPRRSAAGSRRAFSLIEIAVALLVFSLGILAILALFPSGMILSQESQAETYVTDFAEVVFNSIAIEVERDNRFWKLKGSDYTTLVAGPPPYQFATTIPLDSGWSAPANLQIYADNTWRSNTYTVSVAGAPFAEVNLRYKLELRQDTKIMGFLKEDPTTYTILKPPYYDWKTQSLDRAVNILNYFPINDCVLKAELAVRAGLYGSAERSFARYYYNWNNIKRD